MELSNTEYARLLDDIACLQEHGALAGVAEVARERRRQVEEPGPLREGTDWYDDGQVPVEACFLLGRLQESRYSGTADIGSDEDYLRRSAALSAAEIDRLNRMLAT